MTGAVDRPTMKNLMGADRRLPICFSLLSNPSVHPFERINAAGALFHAADVALSVPRHELSPLITMFLADD